MKRLVFSILMILALTAGATYAQSTINTPAPGPTQQQEPGQTNNNLPNPGNPVAVGPEAQQPLQEQGTVEGTATESLNGTQGSNTTGTMGTTGTTGVLPETETGALVRGFIHGAGWPVIICLVAVVGAVGYLFKCRNQDLTWQPGVRSAKTQWLEYAI